LCADRPWTGGVRLTHLITNNKNNASHPMSCQTALELRESLLDEADRSGYGVTHGGTTQWDAMVGELIDGNGVDGEIEFLGGGEEFSGSPSVRMFIRECLQVS